MADYDKGWCRFSVGESFYKELGVSADQGQPAVQAVKDKTTTMSEKQQKC